MKTIAEYVRENAVQPAVNFLPETSNTGKTWNPCQLRSIDESSARRVIDSHTENGYIVVSPCRGLEALVKSGELSDDLSPQSQRQRDEFNRVNQQRIRSMVYDIKKSGYSYTPVYGGFIENKGTDREETVFERSFIIYNADKNGNRLDFNYLYDFGLKLCKAFDQDSFLVQYPDGGRMVYVTQDGEVDIQFAGKKTFNDFSKQYFTDLHKYHSPRSDSKLTRITFESECSSVWLNPEPQGYSERHVRWLNGEIF